MFVQDRMSQYLGLSPYYHYRMVANASSPQLWKVPFLIFGHLSLLQVEVVAVVVVVVVVAEAVVI